MSITRSSSDDSPIVVVSSSLVSWRVVEALVVEDESVSAGGPSEGSESDDSTVCVLAISIVGRLSLAPRDTSSRCDDVTIVVRRTGSLSQWLTVGTLSLSSKVGALSGKSLVVGMIPFNNFVGPVAASSRGRGLFDPSGLSGSPCDS